MRRRALALATTLVLAASCSGGDVLSSADRPATTSAAPAPSSSVPPSAPSTTGAPGARDGAAGVGDPYFAGLGNGGYDVTHYDLALDVEAGGDLRSATVKIDAVATQPLATFHLDFTDLPIDRLDVDGVAAPHELQGDELVVDPPADVASGATFTVAVGYHGTPRAIGDPILGKLGWQKVGDVTFVSDEPGGAHTWYPSNDHPSDKASYHVSVTVPDGTTAVSSGVLVAKEVGADGRTTWVWDHPEPMASYTLALAVGPLTLVESDGPHGIHIRHAFPPALAPRATETFAGTSQLITDLEGLFGPYPFDTYGALVVDGELGYAMESQTLALYPRSIVDGSQFSRVTVVHELAHHWFGNWVSPASWDETWLNEGFASYAEDLWQERVDPTFDIDATMRDVARRPYGPIGDPGAAGMFSSNVYDRGALTLHALRRTIGDAGFFQLLRAWTDRFGGQSASTEDFVALAGEVAGRDLQPFFDSWLDDREMPALPT